MKILGSDEVFKRVESVIREYDLSESAKLSCLKARVRRRQNRFLRFWFLLKLILGENNNVFRLV